MIGFEWRGGTLEEDWNCYERGIHLSCKRAKRRAAILNCGTGIEPDDNAAMA